MSRKTSYKILALAILSAIAFLFQAAQAQDFGIEAVNNGLGGSLSTADPRVIVGRIINISLGFLGVIAVGIVIYAGFLWMSSGGDEEKINSAKKLLKNGVIGLAIILASWGIAVFIITRLSGSAGGSGSLGCTPGASMPCGCFSSGIKVCQENGRWGACVGQSCGSGVGGNPTSCDGSSQPGCQREPDICASSDYCAADCSCRPKAGQGDSCDADPNTASCEADNGQCGEYLTCNPQKGCTCDGPPVITAISPAGGFCEENRDSVCRTDSDCATTCNVGTPIGSVDGFITIFGQNFGEYAEGQSRVTFLGGSPKDGVMPSVINQACVDTWRDDQIVIAVPEGAQNGPISVTNKDNLSDQTDDDTGPAIPDFLTSNLGRPGLCYLSPDRGKLSSEVAYQGVNLFSGQAYFGNYQNYVRALSSQFSQPTGLVGTAMTPNIQPGVSGSFVEKTGQTGVVRSNFLRFVKDPEEGDGPFISSFSPTSGPSGQYVTIRGRGFGGARGLSKVYFGDKEASYDFPDMCLNSVWRDSQIVVKVPAGLADGGQVLKVLIGSTTLDTRRLNPGVFNVSQSESLKTSLCKIEPDRGPAATPVTLWGEYFGVSGSEGLVKFNFDQSATGTIAKDGRADKISTAVPSGAITGPVRVISNSQWGNELNFSVGECSRDSDCGVQICCPANTYKAGSCSQTLAECFIEIPTSVFEWRFSTGFSDGSTTTSPCVGPYCNPDDPCQQKTGFDACSRDSSCCFDAKYSMCRSGAQIPSGDDLGYCAYYNCSNAGGSESTNLSCASETPVRSGTYPDIGSCQYYCTNPPAGIGLSCAGYATSTCASSVCNYPGAACLLESGQTGQQPPACGTCCCQPGTVSPLNPELNCIADQGACSGASRGLYCGCSRDEQCGAVDTVGCGSGACCEARPDVLGTSPAHLSDQVCRNAVIKVDFNQRLNQGTLAENILLLEEREYGDGVCPSGTFIASSQTVEEILATRDSRLVAWVKSWSRVVRSAWQRARGNITPDTALAELPDSSKLYCAIPGQVSGQNSGERGSLVFQPGRILSPSTNYYLVVKGDEELNSRTGVLSFNNIGLNGRGYLNMDREPGIFVEGENIPFNGRTYKNSHIIKFSTLSAQNPTAGICAVDRVGIEPSSYLFNSAQNDLNENDSNFKHPSFDTASDRDKLVSAFAYSADGQILQPVTGYFWDWEFSLSNPAVADIIDRSTVANLPSASVLVGAKEGVTDAETKIEARIKMSRFRAPGCVANRCSCADAACSNNCCNAFLGGDGFNNRSSLYVFICNNPWPPVASTGLWSPWVDNCDGAVTGNCGLYNYKFYYCRDAGEAGTFDDLPAIINQAVIRGESTNLVCSTDNKPCEPGSVSNTTKCGEDRNGDGQADGLCVWNVLKESYFFRSAIPASGEIAAVTDKLTGGAVEVRWRSAAMLNNGVSQIYSYKIYYYPAGQGAMLFKEVKLVEPTNTAPACILTKDQYECQTLISGLSNNVPYTFKLSIVTVDKSESALSAEKSATPTDRVPPRMPSRLSVQVEGSANLKFAWRVGSTDAIKHRIYRGTNPGQYGESFDSQSGANSLSLPLDRISGESNYFTISALDAAGNESERAPEVSCFGAGINISCSESGGALTE